MQIKYSPTSRLAKTVKASALSIGILASGIAQARPNAAFAPYSPLLAANTGLDRLQNIMAGNQVTILGDTDHTRFDEIYGLLADPSFLQAAHKAEVAVIAMELPAAWQNEADDLAAGKISRAIFLDNIEKDFLTTRSETASTTAQFADRKKWNVIANIIENSHPLGFKIAFVDGLSERLKDALHTVVMVYEKYPDEYLKARQAVGSEKSKLFKNFFIDHASELQDSVRTVLKERFSTDSNKRTAASIEALMTPGRHALVIYGLGHASLLNQSFKNDGFTSKTIALFADTSSLNLQRNEMLRISKHLATLSIPELCDTFVVSTRQFASSEPVPTLPALRRPGETPTLFKRSP